MRFKQLLKPEVTGAAFLMATSAVGPGFINNTTVFTYQYFTSFGFAILVSVLLDIAAQMNIWRIIAASNTRAPELANRVFPGMGYLLIVLVSVGGLVFNAGNIAGCGLGLNTLFEMDMRTGAMISGVVAIFIFLVKEFGRGMDVFSKVLGFVMIGLTMYVAISSKPPLGEALYRSVWPQANLVNITSVVALIGGTVGGYISFAGAHRLLDAGISGPAAIKQVTRGSITAIAVASIMRILLFLAAVGVVANGVPADKTNAAAGVFRAAAGTVGLRMFGIILWAAAITSVVGAAYTSVSFLESLHIRIKQNRKLIIISFIVLSVILFMATGNKYGASGILVLAGAINGFILPVALALMLIASRRHSLMQHYKHPLWMQSAGWAVVAIMGWMSVKVLFS